MDFKNVFDSNSISNEEVEAQFAEQLATGLPVIIFAKESSNEEFLNVYIAQKVPVISRANSINRVSKASAFLKNWDNPISDIILRCQDNYSKEKLTNLGLDHAGVILNDMTLRAFDTNEPAYPTQTPIVSSRTQENRTSNGKLIYAQTELVDFDEFEALGGHDVMTYDAVAVPANMVVQREHVESVGAIVGAEN